MASSAYNWNSIKDKPKLRLDSIIGSPNVADRLADDYLAWLGHTVCQQFEDDLGSRSQWDEWCSTWIDLALQVVKQKNFPWPGASNVKFPLVTIACMQYHARAYSTLINTQDLVRYQIFGADPKGERDALGKKISKHMTYQLTEENVEWEEHMDAALLVQPIIGCVFKKLWFDPVAQINKSEMVLPQDFVVSYYTKKLETAPRYTHIFELSKNDIEERIRRGTFLDQDLTARPEPETTSRKGKRNARQGIVPKVSDPDAPFLTLEQHRYLDLDGDGYQEPYIVTVNKASRKVLRVVARFVSSGVEKNAAGRILRIVPLQHFQKYGFIPSPDGGFYDLGFGPLLGPLNESVNTLVNQLIDAGSLANLGGGFLGRGAKIRGGNQIFKPGEWKTVDSTGEDLQKSIYPIPYREPSNVLLQMLQLLISYAERVSGANDTAVGELPGQNTPAETSRRAEDNSLKIYKSIFKRTYRALKEEFQKLYVLNRHFLPKVDVNPFGVTAQDYLADPKGIRPSADPEIASDTQRLMQAQAVRAASRESPGYNRAIVERSFLEALRVRNVDQLFPLDEQGQPAIQPPPNPKVLAEETRKAEVQRKTEEGQTNAKLRAAELLAEVEESKARIKQLEAKAEELKAKAKSETVNSELYAINTQLEVSRAKHEGMLRAVEVLKDVLGDINGKGNKGADQPRGVPGVAGPANNGGGNGAAPPGAGGLEGAVGQ